MYEFKVITSLVIIDKKGNFLLGKRSKDEDVFPDMWSIPGGKVEHGPAQLDVLENNVKREVMEELGVEVEIDRYFDSHSDSEGRVYIIFLGHVTKGAPQPLEDTDEVKWFTFDKLKNLKICPEVYRLLEKAKDICFLESKQ